MHARIIRNMHGWLLSQIFVSAFFRLRIFFFLKKYNITSFFFPPKKTFFDKRKPIICLQKI